MNAYQYQRMVDLRAEREAMVDDRIEEIMGKLSPNSTDDGLARVGITDAVFGEEDSGDFDPLNIVGIIRENANDPEKIGKLILGAIHNSNYRRAKMIAEKEIA